MSLRAWVILFLGLAAAGRQEPAYVRGVNIAGAEFGGGIGREGRDYTFNNEETYKYYSGKGLTVFRVPFKWERLQPVLGGPLDAAYLGGIRRNVEWARAHGGTVILDLHNYARYAVKVGGKEVGAVIDQPYEGEVRVKTSDFSDVWVKLSAEFKGHPGIYGYGLMNEPHDMGTSDWKAISNAVIAALRAAGDGTRILVAGNGWSNARNWGKINGPDGWVKDPASNFLYEAHCYFDHNNSGTYRKSYEEELRADPDLPEAGRRRVADFTDWCRKNGAKGFVGEYGVPRSDPRWLVVLDNFLKKLDEEGIGATYWAGGTWWGEEALTLQPPAGFAPDRPQMAVVQKHCGPVAERRP